MKDELVLLYEDSPAVHFAHRQLFTLAGISVRIGALTSQGPSIIFDNKALWFEQTQQRLRDLAATALRRYAPHEIITNMLIGWDTALAEAAWEAGITYTAMIPYEGMEHRWAYHHQQRYTRVLKHASKVVCVSKGHPKQWMIPKAIRQKAELSDIILSLYDGEDVDTKRYIKQARHHHKRCINLWSSWCKHSGLM